MHNSHLFKNKHRKDSSRLNKWDYSWPGYYFITICVKNRKDYWFGMVENGKIELNVVGKKAEKYWREIPKHFNFIDIDEFVIMPNHIHGIILIKNDSKRKEFYKDSIYKDSIEFKKCRDAIHRVSSEGGITKNYNPMLMDNSLSKVIRWFKGRMSFEIHNIDYQNFQWQPRYYEHIIRTEKSLEKIRDYIQYNPDKWDADKNNPMSKKFRM